MSATLNVNTIDTTDPADKDEQGATKRREPRHHQRIRLIVRNAMIRSLSLILLLLTVQIVGAQSGPGILALRNMLDDKNAEIRIKATEGLARVGGRQAVVMLRRGLSDKDLDVRIAVVKALGFVGGKVALTVLSEALKDKAPEVRLRTVDALKDAGTVNSIPIIQKAFEDKEQAVRMEAALALRKIGHRNGVPVLTNAALNDNSPQVRAAAARHLGKLGVKDPRAVGALSQILADKSPAVRIRAVESLGFLQLPAVVPVLMQALEDKDPGVRIRATEVLGRSWRRNSSKRSGPVLIRALADPASSTRTGIAHTQRRFPDLC